VPDEHDGHEDKGQKDREPRALQELDEGCPEVERLDGSEEEQEGQGQDWRPVPEQDDHQRRQERGDQHHRDHRQSCRKKEQLVITKVNLISVSLRNFRPWWKTKARTVIVKSNVK
jgi:hypothetical protein